LAPGNRGPEAKGNPFGRQMNLNDIDFLFEFYASYEDFQKKIQTGKTLSKVKAFIDILAGFTSSSPQIERFRKQLLGGSNQSYFSINILWLYRWMLSEGYQEFTDEDINNVFEFLDKLKIPEFAAKQISWGIAFSKREELGNCEMFWNTTLLKRIHLVKSVNVNDDFTISDMIGLWMLLHVGLKQLFRKAESKITDTMEFVLTKYINLVNNYSELEEIFGVAIEKDMHRVYRILENEKNHQ
jgi:hypothetical protein